jgi:hypothetical protein
VVTGAYLNYLSQTSPVREELAALKRVQVAAGAQPGPELARLQEELKNSASSLSQMTAERDKYKKLADAPIDFGPNGIDFWSKRGFTEATTSSTECVTRLRAYTNKLAGVAVRSDNSPFYYFEYRKSAYHIVCGNSAGLTAFFAIHPVKDEEEELRVSKVFADMRIALK